MDNSIIVFYDGTVSFTINQDAMKNLKTNFPKGCPFENYSFYDLLLDFIKMYSWKADKNRQIRISDFIFQLSMEYEKVAIYRKEIVDCLSVI